MKTFRKVFFWLHLVAGLVAGISIGVMCLTGTALAFEKQLVAWAERDARRVEIPAGTERLGLDELARRVREVEPEARPAGVTVSADPRDAVAFSLGRDNAVYADPYTGAIRRPASTRMHDFMHVMEDWHRVLGLGGDNRATGKAINGACNLAFCFLAVSGLYLWWPRSLSWRSVRAVAVLNFRLVGKARDFNWHNAIGLWSAPILIVLTLTAVPISYRWGGNLIYALAGETPPAQGQGPGGLGAPAVEIKRPSPEAQPLPQQAVLAQVQQQFPRWETIALRSGGPQSRGPRPAAGASAGANGRPAGSEPARSPSRAEGRGAAPALTATVRESGSWPRTATTTLTLNPYTGEVLKREGYADLGPARQIRSWTRFLHTGEALGLVGQFVAGLACLGGCFLVYTGFALSWRRFFGRRDDSAGTPKPAA